MLTYLGSLNSPSTAARLIKTGHSHRRRPHSLVMNMF
jgi:hypothetical protein